MSLSLPPLHTLFGFIPASRDLTYGLPPSCGRPLGFPLSLHRPAVPSVSLLEFRLEFAYSAFVFRVLVVGNPGFSADHFAPGAFVVEERAENDCRIFPIPVSTLPDLELSYCLLCSQLREVMFLMQ